MLMGFVLSTLNKLPQVKPDLVRTDEGWEDWNMEKLIDSIQKWLKRNKAQDNEKDQTDTKRKERLYFNQKDPHCLFCNQNHWGGSCPTYDTIAKRREFFTTKRLCYNCARSGHTGKYIVVGDALSARANTTPACVISLRGTRRRIPMPL